MCIAYLFWIEGKLRTYILLVGKLGEGEFAGHGALLLAQGEEVCVCRCCRCGESGREEGDEEERKALHGCDLRSDITSLNRLIVKGVDRAGDRENRGEGI